MPYSIFASQLFVSKKPRAKNIYLLLNLLRFQALLFLLFTFFIKETEQTKVVLISIHWTLTSPHGGTVVSNVVAHKKVLDLHLEVSWGLPVWSLHVFPVPAWVFSKCSNFLPLCKGLHFRLIGLSEWAQGVDMSKNGCLVYLVCSAVMNR